MSGQQRYDRLFQQAWLVNDVVATARRWSEVFGAGPFVVVPHHQTDSFSYRGTAQEADVSYAFGYLGDMMIQFIEQHDDTPSIYRDMYGSGEEGFHHIGLLVSDYAAAKRHFELLGFEVACELYADEVNAGYVDTRRLNGGFTEIHADPPHILKAFARWRESHATHGPDDDAIVGR